MQKVKDWDKVQAVGEAVRLPVDGYVCRIMDAKEVTYKGQNGDFTRLEISIDIAEGDYKGYYANDYRVQQQEDKRWKGVLRLYLPKEDGTEQDEWTKRRLKALTEGVEDSNSGFHWDWDEAALKDKLVGVIFRNEEWEFNDRSGWKAQPFKATSVDVIRNQKFSVPSEKPLKNSGGTSSTNTFTEIEGDGDLPF